jgi:hypothetical protein
MSKCPLYPGQLPTWRAKIPRRNEPSSVTGNVIQSTESIAARMARSRQNKRAHRNEANERLQKQLEAEARQRYILN